MGGNQTTGNRPKKDDATLFFLFLSLFHFKRKQKKTASRKQKIEHVRVGRINSTWLAEAELSRVGGHKVLSFLVYSRRKDVNIGTRLQSHEIWKFRFLDTRSANVNKKVLRLLGHDSLKWMHLEKGFHRYFWRQYFRVVVSVRFYGAKLNLDDGSDVSRWSGCHFYSSFSLRFHWNWGHWLFP